MEDWLVAFLVFTLTVATIVLRVVDETVAALAGLVVLVVLTEYTPEQAFHAVDWNVIAILFGMWVITGYMIEGGLAERVLEAVARRSGNYRVFLLATALAAGFVSMFVDNVLVILVFGGVVLEAARRSGGNPVLAILLVGFSANFMGTALLMGDLPPQLLHSVAGAEFWDFIVHSGRPGSFPLLTVTFLSTLAVYYLLFVRREPSALPRVSKPQSSRWEPWLLPVSVAFFAATVAAMAVRPLLGVPLGFITVAGAAATALFMEAARKAGCRVPSFEDVLSHVEWRALLFYAALFSLVGGLEETGALQMLAFKLVPLLEDGSLKAYTASYWIVAALSTFIEHDALLLTFLYTVRDASQAIGLDPWPLYWAMAWSATLASNATTAAAPALYIAVTMAEEAGYRIGARDFLRYSIPFVAISLSIHYLVTAPIWGVG